MGTLRDDFVRVGKRLMETVEERTGREVVPKEDLALLESDRAELRSVRKMLHTVGWEILNYQPGDAGALGGFELRSHVRRFAARQSLAAWLDDPLAGQAVDLYVSFVAGRGVPRCVAPDPLVQKHLDAAWDDPAARRIFTSFETLVEKTIDLCVNGSVGFTFFDQGEDGFCRPSLLPFDAMEDVIRHDELAADGRGDHWRILYMKVLERRVQYDFATGMRGTPAGSGSDEVARTVFYEMWDAFDEDNAVQAVQDEGLQAPPAAQMRDGKVYLLTANKTSEMAFGVPRMRRLMNWYGAYNDMLVSFRDRMKAMASVYMKATVKGSERDLNRLGNMAVGRASAYGPAEEDRVRPSGPVSPGILGQNESLNYEPFKIDSGAGDVSSAAPVMRSQLTGPWPDSFISGNADATVGGGQSLELPTLKFVEREQELWNGLFRAFGKANVDAAVRVGDIPEWRDPTTAETEQIALAEARGEEAPFELNEQGQIKRDLSFSVALPNPLKRAMTDIVSAAVATATGVDPNGQNPGISRWLFATILAEAFDVENPMKIVDEFLPRHVEQAPAPGDGQADPATGKPLEGSIGPDGQRHPADNPNGVPRKVPDPEDRKVQEAAVDERLLEVDDGFEDVAALAARYLQELAELPTTPEPNGNGNHHR